MIPKSTERQLSPTQVARYRQGDPAIYLRTYEVINSLDQAQNVAWWEKILASISRFRQSAPKPPARLKRPPVRGVPPVAVPVSETLEGHLTLVPTTTPQVVPEYTVHLSRPAKDGKRVSWVLLAVVAMVTAGLTFALVHFAWPSLETRSSWPQEKRVSGFITAHSEVLPRSF